MIKTLMAILTVLAVLSVRAVLKLMLLPFRGIRGLFRSRPAAA
ncbi:hypothetical protein [Methylobacterium trifolii]|nr:hypothetical protein [Methylobacterium trifolii]